MKRVVMLAQCFDSKVEVCFDCEAQFLVGIKYLCTKESLSSNIKTGLCGRGVSLLYAVENFLEECRGRLLVYDPPPDVGKRKELFYEGGR